MLMDWAQVIGVIVAGIGLLFTAREIRRSSRQRRLEAVAKVRGQIFGEEDIQEIYYQLEYQEFKYSPNFHGSKEEKSMDRLLGLLDSIAKEVEVGLLEVNDLELVGYEYLITYQDREVQKYFDFLDAWYVERGISQKPFESFRSVGRQLEGKLG